MVLFDSGRIQRKMKRLGIEKIPITDYRGSEVVKEMCVGWNEGKVTDAYWR